MAILGYILLEKEADQYNRGLKVYTNLFLSKISKEFSSQNPTSASGNIRWYKIATPRNSVKICKIVFTLHLHSLKIITIISIQLHISSIRMYIDTLLECRELNEH